jgi:hypothetical protein
MTYYHVFMASRPAPLHWAKRCENCGFEMADTSRAGVRKSMAAADVPYQIQECSCASVCRCAAEEVEG